MFCSTRTAVGLESSTGNLSHSNVMSVSSSIERMGVAGASDLCLFPGPVPPVPDPPDRGVKEPLLLGVLDPDDFRPPRGDAGVPDDFRPPNDPGGDAVPDV